MRARLTETPKASGTNASRSSRREPKPTPWQPHHCGWTLTPYEQMHRFLQQEKQQVRWLNFAVASAYLGLCLSVAVVVYIVIGPLNKPSILKHGSDMQMVSKRPVLLRD